MSPDPSAATLMPPPSAAPVDDAVGESATLAINRIARERVAAGQQVVHLGFGEAGLPAAPELVARLAAAASANDYRPSAGGEELREAAAGFFSRRGLATDARQICVGPGSKPLLFALLRVLPGDVILPQPCWVSYGAQAALAGRRVVRVPIPQLCGGIPEPAALETCVQRLRAQGGDPRVLVVTLPDNPTGTTAPEELVRAVVEVCREQAITIISDEIYRDLAATPDAVCSPSRYLPEQTIVTTGLSKSLALGGWRIGIARFPDNDFGERARRATVGVASEVWSSLASPMEDVAAWAFQDPQAIVSRVAASRRLHRRVADAMFGILEAHGVGCRRPTAGFYLYPEFSSMAEQLRRLGVTTDVALAAHLLEERGIASLPGSAFGDDPTALRLRLSTSLLYGASSLRREQALAAPDATSLPWIAAALDHCAMVLSDISQGR